MIAPTHMNGNPNTSCRKLTGILLPLVLSSVCLSAVGSAQTSGIPASLQVELLAKLESYDRSFANRAGKLARVLIVVKPGSARSELSANEMKSALERIDQVGGLPHEEVVVDYVSAVQLAERVRAERVAIVFLAADLDDAAITAIATALSDLSVLTVGAVSGYVAKGIVLGFELESGKPRLVINLARARRQKVDFSSNVLRLMKVSDDAPREHPVARRRTSNRS
jgi:YfiR/HmsC-like